MRATPVVLGLSLALAAWAKSPLIQEQRPGNGPVLKGLRIHEWGVFLTGKEGARTSAGGEAPTFVQRVQMPPRPVDDPDGPCAEKPVLHVYPPRPLELSVHVSFPGGSPTLAWPRGNAGWMEDPALSWTLRAGGEEAGDDPLPPKVPDSHWIARARRTPAAILRSGRDAEHFLFYEGKVDRIQDVQAREGKGGLEVLSDVARSVWSLDCGGKALRFGRADDVFKTQGWVEATAREAAPEALRGELDGALKAAGLSEAEAGIVLDIWMPELVRPGRRLVYLLPREEYDRLLPISFDPMPEELERVGLVVQELP